MAGDRTNAESLRRLTRLLAEMQATINCAGLRAFAGDFDRFVIFALILREALPPARPRPISAHSLSISLHRSFETVRRHINALIRDGYCARVRGGVTATDEIVVRPDIAELIRLSNDSFVRFVEDLGPLESFATRGMRLDMPYDPGIGVSGAVDILLTTVETNRGQHGDWLDLALFSTVLCANAQRHERTSAGDDSALDERHAVRASIIARAMALPETTVRRRAQRLVEVAGTLIQCRGGLLVSRSWLASPDAAAITAATLAGVRLQVRNAVARGFPIESPALAYLDGRPPAYKFA